MTTTPTAIRIADIKFVMQVGFKGFCPSKHQPSPGVRETAREFMDARWAFTTSGRPTHVQWSRYVRAARRWHRVKRACRTCAARWEAIAPTP